jgi:putative CocE/NonD family hydrolase
MFNRRLNLIGSLILVIVAALGVIATASGEKGGRGSGDGAALKPVLGLRMPMRDGVELSADVWMPAANGKYPIILVRTPYMKNRWVVDGWAQYFASRGYVYVVQDVRGRGDSDGKFGFFFQEGKDGYDSIEWLASQEWSNGRVGMLGLSYLGSVQWLAARERPPHLVCIVPTAPAGRYINEIPYIGGAFRMSWALHWVNGTSARIRQADPVGVDWKEIFKHRPLITMDEAMGRRMPLYRDFLQHATLDDYWKRIQFTKEDFKKLDIPALTVTGWFDGDQPGALSYWDGMREYSPARDKQYLIAGPWNHPQTFTGGELKMGDLAFSGDSVLDMKAEHLKFFERYLKESTQTLDFPRARLFITGSNQWISESSYPVPDSQPRKLFLHSGGRANSLIGDGRLAWTEPGEESADHFTYNPQNPAPEGVTESSTESSDAGMDQRPVERRDDVLVYTGDELKETIEVVGRVFVDLFAASDARDTDFTAKLLDVYPDGRALKLCVNPVGAIRARYRNGFDREELLSPGKPEKFRIWLFDIAHAFLPGHKIRVEISSSAYPYINPNSNTGNPVATDTEWKVANQTIFHNSKLPSSLEVPVMQRNKAP